MDRDDQPLNTLDVARLLGLSRKTIEAWRYSGYGPQWHRIGRRSIRYYRSEVEAWLAEQERRSA